MMQNLVGQVIYVGGSAVARITSQDGDKLTVEAVGKPVPGETPMPAPGDWQTIDDSNTGVSMKVEGDAKARKLSIYKDTVLQGVFDQVFAGEIEPGPVVETEKCAEYTIEARTAGKRTFITLSKPVEFYFARD